jgi:hypothetical protein
MKAYRPRAIAAGNARTDEETLLEFGRATNPEKCDPV